MEAPNFSLRNDFKMAFSSIRSNKKTIILSIIGLTIAFTIAFQMFFFLFSSKGSLIASFLSGEYSEGLFGGMTSEEEEKIEIGPDLSLHFYQQIFPSEPFAQSIQTEVIAAGEASGNSEIISGSRLCFSQPIDFHYQSTQYGYNKSQTINLNGLGEEDIDFLQSYLERGGFSPFNSSSTDCLLFCYSRAFYEEINVSADRKFIIDNYYTENQAVIKLAVDPLPVFALGDSSKVTKQFTRRFGDYVVSLNSPGILVTTHQGVRNILTSMGFEQGVYNARYVLNIDLDYSELGLFSVRRDIREIHQFEVSLSNAFVNDPEKYVMGLYTRIAYNLETFVDDFLIIQMIILTLTIPPICIAAFMLNFSFNLIRSQNIHQINLLKIRGATAKQISFTLILEMILSTLVALIFGPLLSLPFLYLVSKTSGFLQFENKRLFADYGLNVSWKIILMVLIIGLVLSFIINLPRIISLSRLKAKNIETRSRKKSKPIWKRFYIDIFLTVLALIDLSLYLISLNYFPEETRIIFSSIFGVSTPILLMASISLLIARFFNPIIQWLGNKIWTIKSGSFALSVKNLAFREKQTSRAIILIVLTVTFGILSAVVPSTIDYNVRERWNYMLGADVVVFNIDIDDSTLINGLGSYSYVSSVTPVITHDYLYVPFPSLPLQTEVLGLDPYTFLSAAYMREGKFKFSDSIADLFQSLKTPGKILMQADNMESVGLQVGDGISSYGSNIQNYQIVGSFEYFPNLVESKQLSSAVSSQAFIVGSIYTIRQMIQDFASYEDPLESLYIKQAEPQTGQLIKQRINNNYPGEYAISVVDTGVEEDLDLPARIAVYAMLNSAFLTTVGCTIAGIGIYSFLILLDRSKELALIRALGGMKIQLYMTIIFETIELLFIGVLLGLPLGIGTSIIVSKIMTSYYDVPPLIISIPAISLLIFTVVLFIISFLGAIIPGYLASRQEINKLARAT
ncbi:MAG: FtsX-like permease family protein [Candidatus Heimdallarchaeota archaeon]|nr:FtsX-like permease family protein [Candidatus Heimdallarchaeota archaeon]